MRQRHAPLGLGQENENLVTYVKGNNTDNDDDVDDDDSRDTILYLFQ